MRRTVSTLAGLVLILAFSLNRSISQSNWYWQNPLPQGNTLHGLCAASPSTMIGVGTAGSILKTTDKGSTWTFVALADTIVYFSDVAFTDTLKGLAVGIESSIGGVIYRTSDGGQHWTRQAGSAATGFEGVAFASSGIAVAVGNKGAAWRSTDGGITWEARRTDTTKTLHHVLFQSTSDGIAVGSNGMILRTTDAGLTWIPVATSTTEALWSVKFFTRSTGMAVGSRSVILLTTDGGASWSSTNAPGYGMLVSVAWFDSTTCVVTQKQDVSFRTTNRGQRWDTVSTLSGANAVVGFADGTGLAVGWDGLISRTSDAGLTWSSRVNSRFTGSFNRVQFVDTLVGWAAGQLGGFDPSVLHTKDGGATWMEQNWGAASSPQFYFKNRNSGWAAGVSPAGSLQVHKTTDGGTTWVPRGSPGSTSIRSLYFTDEDFGWAVGSGGTIAHTTDGGTSWTTDSSGTSTELTSVHFIDRLKGWVVGWSGVVLRTSDGGKQWLPIASQTTKSLYSVDFGSANRGVIVGDASTILNTTDGGMTWTMQTIAPSSNYLRCVSFSDSIDVWAAGEAGRIVTSSDGGVAWRRQMSTSSQDLFGISAVKGGKGWAVGKHGTILSTNRPGEPAVTVKEDRSLFLTSPLSAVLHQNFPNPFNPSTTIRYGLPNRSPVTLTVFNTLGQQAAVLQNGEQDAGYHEVTFDGKNLSSGVYFYRLRAGGFVETKRLLLLR
jgi:photosystem II stability/assembly factor-like uncharacterized protein